MALTHLSAPDLVFVRHKEGDHRLGAWVSTQRASEGTLTAERVHRLDEIGSVSDVRKPYQTATNYPRRRLRSHWQQMGKQITKPKVYQKKYQIDVSAHIGNVPA